MIGGGWMTGGAGTTGGRDVLTAPSVAAATQHHTVVPANAGIQRGGGERTHRAGRNITLAHLTDPPTSDYSLLSTRSSTLDATTSAVSPA